MKYRVTCLTPTLVGDGQRLSPIDYMVWKDHVNVLDQRRIFKLLSRGPRLEGYLAQLKRAERLDFASWGGFAQNFAGRRIPFEHASAAAAWERARPEHLFIPTFANSPSGPYLPATAVKGALRTGAVAERWTEATLTHLAARIEDRVPRYFASKAEEAVLGGGGSNRMKRVGASDSSTISHAAMKVYLLRISTLVARGGGKLELGWKSERGSGRVDDATPLFAEMTMPGTSFEGIWTESSDQDRARLFRASNAYAESLLARHRDYAEQTGMKRLTANLDQLSAKLSEVREGHQACLLSIGWGGGLLGKSAYTKTDDEPYRQILRHVPIYQRAIQTGLPFPKTRKVIFENNEPASLPGWVLLEVLSPADCSEGTV